MNKLYSRRKSSSLFGRNRLILYLFILVLALYFGRGTRGGEEAAGDKQPEQAVEQVADQVVSESISAMELARLYREDPKEGSRRFKKQRLTVTGRVYNVDSFMGKSYIKFYTGEDSSNLQYFIDSDEAASLQGLKQGDEVTVTGVCQGIFQEVVVIE